MLRDPGAQPLTAGFAVHGHDVETVWEDDVPLDHPARALLRAQPHRARPGIHADRWRLLVSGDGVHRQATWSLAQRGIPPTCGDRGGAGVHPTAWRLLRPAAGHAAARHPVADLGAIGVARWSGVRLFERPAARRAAAGRGLG